jgi:hypothetical protein
MQKILAEATRNKQTKRELFLVSFHFAEELESIKTDFGSALDAQVKELVTKFVDVTKTPQGIPPHKGIFDHKISLTAYPKHQRRSRLYVPEVEELKRQCTNFFKKELVLSLIVRMLYLSFWFGNLMVLFGYVSIIEH